jgi:hypothetical protein
MTMRHMQFNTKFRSYFGKNNASQCIRHRWVCAGQYEFTIVMIKASNIYHGISCYYAVWQDNRLHNQSSILITQLCLTRSMRNTVHIEHADKWKSKFNWFLFRCEGRASFPTFCAAAANAYFNQGREQLPWLAKTTQLNTGFP